MNSDEAAIAFLSLATEDEHWLYEAVWDLNTRFPGESIGQKYDVAKQALANLYSRGWIDFKLVRGVDEEGLSESVNETDIATMLENPVSWYPEYDGATVVFFATDAGNAHYFGEHPKGTP
jgi:hypothetical protein